jgi:tRNA(Ile)-lysidine synthase
MSCGILDAIRRSVQLAQVSSGSILLAVSGGSDSMALLAACDELRDGFPGRFEVAHFDHGWRPQSAADAEFVRQAAERCGLPFHCERGGPTVRRSEDSARAERYAFLSRVAEEGNCTAILTAHTADDQAETVLHHLLRGTGLSGLAGIPAIRPLPGGILLLRPLVERSRAELRAYLARREWGFRDDPTNNTSEFTRGRIRHQLLPLLAELGFESAGEQLRRLSRQAGEARDALAWMAEQLLDRAVLEQTSRVCRLDLRPLRPLPRHLLREVFVTLWKRSNWPRQKMGFTEWDRLANLDQGSRSYQLPGGIGVNFAGEVLRLDC